MFVVINVILLFLTDRSSQERLNACKTIEAYTNKTTENCYYNPNFYRNTSKIILGHNYPLEEHYVTTNDGYVLLVHRIPHNRRSKVIGPPVFIQHGALTSSEVFVLQGEKSLGFLFSNMGYDVWLGNSRGNYNCPNHVNWTVSDQGFWDYSLDEMGIYDLPAVIDRIAKVTRKPGEIIYIGHSQGTTTAMIYSTVHNDHAERNLKALILLAPIAYVSNLPIPGIRLASALTDFVYFQLGLAYVGNELTTYLAICTYNAVTMRLCKQVPEFLYGKFEDIDAEYFPMYFRYAFQRESTKALVHFAQMARSDKFSAFNYGAKTNMKIYKTPNPPLYNFRRIKVPVVLFYSENDRLATNVQRLYKELRAQSKYPVRKIVLRGINGARYNHGSFVSVLNFETTIFQPILDYIKTL